MKVAVLDFSHPLLSGKCPAQIMPQNVLLFHEIMSDIFVLRVMFARVKVLTKQIINTKDWHSLN